jgi:hypothetical protein
MTARETAERHAQDVADGNLDRLMHDSAGNAVNEVRELGGPPQVDDELRDPHLLLQQDRHPIHHLYPQIPWYRYRAAFRELRPTLVANGAIIQGSGTSPHVPVQLREHLAAEV